MRIEDIRVGQTLRVRAWDDMANEFETLDDGDLYIRKYGLRFNRRMREMCGNTVVVRGIGSRSFRPYCKVITTGDNGWVMCAEFFEQIEVPEHEIEGDYLLEELFV